MTFNDWKEVSLDEVILFNPRESLKKGTKAKKIGMDKLAEFKRKITGYEYAEFKSGTKFRNGDTLLARITPCLENGKTAQVDILDENEVAFGSTEFIVMREIPEKSHNDFIYYLSISDKLRNIAIKSMTGTSGRQRAQRDVLEKTKISIPPLDEQKAIANILSTLDEKIETNNQINEKLEEMAQSLFKHWFVDFEFPNENGEPYKTSGGKLVESELGLVPQGWEIKTLSSFIEIKGGLSYKSEYISDNGNPLITMGCVSGKKRFNFNGLKYYKGEYKSQHILKPNDIVIATRDVTQDRILLGSPAMVPKILGEKDIIVATNIYKVINDSFLTNQFLYNLLRTERYRGEIIASAKGTTVLMITKDSIENFKLPIPPVNYIKKFTEIADALYDQYTNNEKENLQLYNLKEELLPKLISGEIRVPI